jgi:hypothetical protein
MVERLYEGKTVMGIEDKSGGRKTFTVPELRVYGRARDITRIVGNNNRAAFDGGQNNNQDKTR